MSESDSSNSVVRGPERLQGSHRVDGAARLAGVAPRERAGDRRTLEAFSKLGIPLDWMWGTYDVSGPGKVRVRHAALVVPGSGRTAMVFLSTPDETGALGSIDGQVQELSESIAQACDWVAREQRSEVHLIQALPQPDDWWAISACERAGFTRLGDLIYLCADLTREAPRVTDADAVPAGMEIRTLEGDRSALRDRASLLVEMLDRTYEQTLDCPELCGLRDTQDVLDSHRLAGEFDPRMWFLAFENQRPVGCGLFSRAKDKPSVELVYLGVAPEARKRGLARHLMRLGMDAARAANARELTCAVDARNAPAIALYDRFGLSEVGRRVALVRSTRATHGNSSRS